MNLRERADACGFTLGVRQVVSALLLVLASPILIHSFITVVTSFRLAFLLLAASTAVASFFPVRLPSLKGENSSVKVTTSDLFIFLAILIISPEAATLLAVLDCLLISRGVSSLEKRAANLGTVTLATFLSARLFYFLVGVESPLGANSAVELSTLSLAFTAAILIHFLLSSTIVSFVVSLSLNERWSVVWRKDFFWSCLTNSTGGFAAIAVFLSFTFGGAYAFLLIIPVGLIMHYSYRINSRRVETLIASRTFLQSTLNSLSTAIAILDQSGRIVAVNGVWQNADEANTYGRAFEVGSDYLAGSLRLVEPWKSAGRIIHRAVQSLIEGEAESVRCEYHSTDQLDPESYVLSVTRFPDNSRIVIAHENVTELRQAERRIVHLAYYDELTGLPNRVFLTEYLPGVIKRARRMRSKVALLSLDLNNFERINNTLGHEIGDRLLCAVASRLSSILMENSSPPRSVSPQHRLENESRLDTVVRFGGDEFLAVLVERTSHKIEEKVRRVIREIAEAFELSEHEIFLGSNIGVSIWPDDSQSAETMIRHSDSALYNAKQKGRNHFSLFSQTIASNSAALFEIEHRIRRALEVGDFILHYQPRFEIETGLLLGAEALIRMTDRPERLTPPSDFIPVAEETGLILPLTEWALRQACRQNQKWCTEFSSNIKVAVNLSSRDLVGQENPTEIIRKVLDETGMDPRLLELEITESTLLDDLDAGIEVLDGLRSLGLSIALDDFGTGYSSLSYLAKLPIDTIKIDRSFLRDTRNRQNLAIVRAIVAVGRSLHLQIVAEGVETEGQLQYVRMLGCQEVQGYLCSPPVEPDKMVQFLQRDLIHFPLTATGWKV